MSEGIWQEAVMANLNQPDFSVVIPTYNHAHFLGKCLQSVLNQTFQNWEAIVVNNFSQDNTIVVVESFKDPRIRLVNFRNNGIIAASRNQGIKLAQGDYIAFLDSDDWWYPKKLEVAKRYFPESDIVYHDLDTYTPKGKRLLKKIRGRHLKKPIFVDLMINGNPMANSSVAVKKQIVQQVGGLSEDPSIVTSEDFDLWLRICKVTDKFAYIPKTLGVYWDGGGSMTEVSERQIARDKAIYDKYLSFLTEKEREQAKISIVYSMGRAKQKMGLWDEALEFFKRSAGFKSFKIGLKSIFLILLIYLLKMRSVR
jgi:glycosyltransferase involved in cell wall biosynthesis